MTVEIREESPASFAAHAWIPIAFEVRERLAVVEAGLGGVHLVLERVKQPYVKDYDADPAHHPATWATRLDISHWGVLAAYAGDERVGGTVVAWDTPGLEILDGRSDVAVIWDLRVGSTHRRRGVGGALFRAAEAWALVRGARWLKVETQNVNVVACRFYASQGCELGAVLRFAYLALPDEVQLFWYKPLGGRARAG